MPIRDRRSRWPSCGQNPPFRSAGVRRRVGLIRERRCSTPPPEPRRLAHATCQRPDSRMTATRGHAGDEEPITGIKRPGAHGRCQPPDRQGPTVTGLRPPSLPRDPDWLAQVPRNASSRHRCIRIRNGCRGRRAGAVRSETSGNHAGAATPSDESTDKEQIARVASNRPDETLAVSIGPSGWTSLVANRRATLPMPRGCVPETPGASGTIPELFPEFVR
jgi:hypothetical protein